MSAGAETPAAAVRAAGLRKAFGDLVAVDGVDFEVRVGECFGFLGPNGAGKTTTMRMAYRASPVGGGELEVLGLEAASGRNDRAIKARIGVVPQDDNLDAEMTLDEHLIVFARFHGLHGEAARKRVREVLGLVELKEHAHRPIITLSGGMRRRGLIARGLLGEPDLLVLDEPTTGLDPKARQRLWDAIDSLKERGATLLLTTHYMQEAHRMCDRLVVMDRGRIIARGTPDELIEEHAPGGNLEDVFLSLTGRELEE